MGEFITFNYGDIVSKGLFFRFPIQTVYYDWYGNMGESPMWPKSLNKILNIFRMKHAKKHSERDDAAGFNFLEWCSPIYFKRTGRESITVRKNQIVSIHSKGFGPYKNNCGGASEKEITIIKFIENKKTKSFKIVNYGSYKYCYNHEIEKLNL